MNEYYSIVMRLIEDHFSNEDKGKLVKELSANKQPAPKKMTTEQEKEEYYFKWFDKHIGGK